MPLSCTCDYDPEPGETIYYHPTGYETYTGPRAKRCASCHALVRPGDLVASFPRYKIPKHDVECYIYGEDGEIPRAPDILCEICADLFFSLDELGFCAVSPRDNMRELLDEYHEEYL